MWLKLWKECSELLDLRKKQQETELKLHGYKNLYEDVKSARNKYVNMIQNSSQDLAELKEQIKIMQNDLEILKNESARSVPISFKLVSSTIGFPVAVKAVGIQPLCVFNIHAMWSRDVGLNSFSRVNSAPAM